MAERTRCTVNPHADTCCWHWRGKPPTPQTQVQADCCWCGGYATFGYEAILDGLAPVTPSPGAVHGTAHVEKLKKGHTVMALNKTENGYCLAAGRDVYEGIPKAVWAAIAVSSLTCGGDQLEYARKLVLDEWQALYDCRIVPQQPPRSLRASR